jgi:tight adherence protein C
MATFYRVQKMAGRMGEKARDKMLQAGNRDPKAPFKFMIAQGALPIVLCLLAMLLISASEKDVSNGVTMMILAGAVLVGYKLPDIGQKCDYKAPAGNQSRISGRARHDADLRAGRYRS